MRAGGGGVLEQRWRVPAEVSGAIAAGAQVVVSDASGTTVAIGSITQGQVSIETPPTCVLDFAVPDVPGGKGFYGVAVGHRAPVKISEDTARKNVSLTFS